ncbi:ornithine cyclodeaminase family protein [Amycolatopsis sp. WQ 127309]|uniref:ornithine cyclodeaminase family protein n=1 Tax=Amycolatopsis sp. WQ 127309 TaxID=2932773 RepID=UPI001FF48393|nr:ornithine cyclodeaminase family protein [Amycolatopsis sp. WQ 127309]UOZ11327.1 ornithine cyclodeaminase family protein [Amycolatopsis sp. WQ 127309]
MTLLVLSGADVRASFPPKEGLAPMREALKALSRGDAHQPLRPVVAPEGAAGLLAMMPAYTGTDGYGVKIVCLFEGNTARGLDAHQGAMVLFSGDTGEALALLNASVLTELRTPATTAVATETLANPDATDVTIFGLGVQGAAHIRTLAAVRPLRRVQVVTRSDARAVCAALSADLDLPVVVASSPEDAVRSADIVITATNAVKPLLRHSWLRPGTHVNAIGSCVPHTRELDTATMASSRVFVDSAESATHEAGDYVFAAREGAAVDLTPLGDVLLGRAPGRESEEEITVFESVGLAIQDLAAARFVYARAEETGAGTRVEY